MRFELRTPEVVEQEVVIMMTKSEAGALCALMSMNHTVPEALGKASGWDRAKVRHIMETIMSGLVHLGIAQESLL